MATNDIIQCKQFDLSCLQNFLNEADYEDVKSALDMPDGWQYSIDRFALNDCEVGCLFNIDCNEAVTPKLTFNIDDVSFINLPKKIRIDDIVSDSVNNEQTAELQFIYECEEEGFYKLDSIQHKNILESSVAHFVHTRLMGYKVMVKLTAKQNADQPLKDIVAKVKSTADLEIQGSLDGLTCSISGELPTEYHTNEIQFDQLSLKKFTSTEFFDGINDKFVLKALLLPVDLAFYFSPALRKIDLIKEFFKAQNCPHYRNIFDEVVDELLEKIKIAARLIKSGQPYSWATCCIQDVTQKLPNSTEDLIGLIEESLEDSIITELNCHLFHGEKEDDKDDQETIFVEFPISVSSRKMIENVKQEIGEVFNSENSKNVIDLIIQGRNNNLKGYCQEFIPRIEEFNRQCHLLKDNNPKAYISTKISLFSYKENDSISTEDSVQVKISRNNELLNANYLLNPVQNLSVKQINFKTVRISFNGFHSDISTTTSYRVLLRTVSDQHDDESNEREQCIEFNSSDISTEKEETCLLIQDLQEGEYIVSVQVVLGEIYGVKSEWSDLIQVHLDHMMKKLDKLKLELQEIATGSTPIEKFTDVECDIGWLFDVEKQTPISSLIDPQNGNGKVADTFEDGLSIRKLNQDLKHLTVNFIYRESQESLNDQSDSINQKTIQDSVYAHYVHSRIQGHKVNVDLEFKSENKEIHAKVTKMICDKNSSFQADDIPEDIILSISGSIPDEFIIEREDEMELDEDEIDKIRKFHDLDVFKHMEKTCTILVNILPLNMVTYFLPLIDEITDFRFKTASSKDLIIGKMSAFICELIINKIRECARKIVSCENYTEDTQFLQNLFKSYLLNAEQWEMAVKQFNVDILRELENLMTEVAKNRKDTQTKSKEIYLDFCLYFSPKCPLIAIKEKIKEMVSNNQMKSSIKPIIKDFSKLLKVESLALLSDYQSNLAQLSLNNQECVYNENVQVVTSATKTMSFDEDSCIGMEIRNKKGSRIKHQPPLLDELEIKTVRALDNNSFEISWIMPDSIKSCCTGHRITVTSFEGEQPHNLPDVILHGLENLSIRQQKATYIFEEMRNGVYSFRVQPIYHNILGKQSEPSDPICTKEFLKSFENARHEPFSTVYERPSETKEINVLVLGETGVGKSTWINGIFNYFRYHDLCTASQHELHALIPSRFYSHGRTIFVGKQSENENTSAIGESCTQRPKLYPITYGNCKINIIDTPGIGDSRGIARDEENLDNILAFLTNFKTLHGVCILLKPNHSRITVWFRFCIQELLIHLHSSIVHNIVFCFTHARQTHYEPGDTLPTLQNYLHQKKIPLRVNPGTNCFSFDNEAFRYLACLKNNVKNIDRYFGMYSESWNIARDETLKLFEHICQRPPHQIADTITINNARNAIVQLGKPLAFIVNDMIPDYEKKTKEAQTKLDNLDKEICDLGQILNVTVKDYEAIPLDYPRTVCTDKDCTKIVSIGMDNQETKKVYEQICHDKCNIRGIPSETINDARVAECSAFLVNNINLLLKFLHLNNWYEIPGYNEYDCNDSNCKIYEGMPHRHYNCDNAAIQKRLTDEEWQEYNCRTSDKCQWCRHSYKLHMHITYELKVGGIHEY